MPLVKTLRRLFRDGWVTKPAPDLPENSLSSEEIDSNFLALEDQLSGKENAITQLGVAKGGTGKGSVASGNFLTGNGTSPLTERTPAQVRSLISAEPAFIKNSAFNKNFGTGSDEVCRGDDLRLTPQLVSHTLADHSDVVGWANANPVMDGVATPGATGRVSDQGHRHPTDTSRAPVSHALSTHSDCEGWATVAPLEDGVASIGSSNRITRQDHRHPTDSTRAPISRALPAGGLANQALGKRTNSDFDMTWLTVPTITQIGRLRRVFQAGASTSWSRTTVSYASIGLAISIVMVNPSNLLLVLASFSGGVYTTSGTICTADFSLFRTYGSVDEAIHTRQISVSAPGGYCGILSPISISCITNFLGAAGGQFSVRGRPQNAGWTARAEGQMHIAVLEIEP